MCLTTFCKKWFSQCVIEILAIFVPHQSLDFDIDFSPTILDHWSVIWIIHVYRSLPWIIDHSCTGNIDHWLWLLINGLFSITQFFLSITQSSYFFQAITWYSSNLCNYLIIRSIWTYYRLVAYYRSSLFLSIDNLSLK